MVGERDGEGGSVGEMGEGQLCVSQAPAVAYVSLHSRGGILWAPPGPCRLISKLGKRVEVGWGMQFYVFTEDRDGDVKIMLMCCCPVWFPPVVARLASSRASQVRVPRLASSRLCTATC